MSGGPVGNPAIERGRHSAIDWLKCAAILAVVVTHAGFAAFPGTPGYTKWDSALRMLLPSFHVPCLLMISGYLYFRPLAISWRQVFDRLQRVLAPYLVASLVMFAAFPAAHPTLQSKAVALLLADALPIYYYVFLLTVFVLALPILSRVPRPAVRVIVGVLLAILAAMSIAGVRASLDFRIAMRNPVESFALGYFLTGWLWAAEDRSLRWMSGSGGYIAVLVVAGAWPLCIAAGSPYPAIGLAKIPYAVAVWLTAWRFLEGRRPPRLVTEISDSTYGIFLYHLPFMVLLYGVTGGWHPLLRIAALTAAGVGGGLACGELTRRVFGTERSRFWFGY